MKVEFHKQFKKSYKKRIAPNLKLTNRFKERLELFLKNPNHPTLQNHDLVGKKLTLKAFSVTGDIRVVYALLKEDEALFLDIGTHNQVY
tara:strand:+ start:335 stop:601 length:267 start_codon:yes stop_codon:yes gene_type:complete